MIYYECTMKDKQLFIVLSNSQCSYQSLALQYFHNKHQKQMQKSIQQKNIEDVNEIFEDKSNFIQNFEEIKGDHQQVEKIGNNQTMQKFKLSGRKANSFTKEEMIIFANKFQEFRSKWGLYTATLKKTEKQIKNLFYNSLRKLATQLSNMQKKMKLFQKNKIEALILHHLINISYTVKDSFDKMDIGIQELLVFKVKDKIFDYCFRSVQYDQQDLIELSKNVRKLKFYLKNMKLVKSAENEKQAIRLAETMINKETEGSYQPKLRNSRVDPTDLYPSPEFDPTLQQQEEQSPVVQYHMEQQNMIHAQHPQLDWQANNYQMINNIHYPYLGMPYQMPYPAQLGQPYSNYAYQGYQQKNQKIKAEIPDGQVKRGQPKEIENKQKLIYNFDDGAVFHSQINIKMKSRDEIKKTGQVYQSIILQRHPKNECKF